MGRIIFHVSVDSRDMGSMEAIGFDDVSNSVLDGDYYRDLSSTDAYQELNRLMGALKGAGFNLELIALKEVEKYGEFCAEDEETPAFVLNTGDKETLAQAQCNIFRPLLAKLQEQVKNMNLEEFSTEPTVVFDISQNIDNRCDDVVYLDTGSGPAPYTLHGFIRRLQANTTYFFAANAVYMH